MVRKITNIKIIELYLNDYGKRYYLRELAELLKKPHQTIKPYVESLVKQGILTKIKRRNLVEYSLNFKAKKIHDYLVIAEKERLIERLEGDTYLMALFEKLSDFFNKNTFIIFGSAVIKIQKDSDIDILIIGKKNVAKAINDFEKVYNKKIHCVQTTTLERLNLSLIKEIYKKHLIFNNTECVVRFLSELHEKNKLV